ncbi:phage tail assembly chaperone [Pseudomonas fluorescens]|uniref:phage tail assembly chaperone n=1 Tax=Pseudomonas fluorescens TaxID=294 RepID=UPI00054C0417|nr:phage tail assembly chaperone [Pseudomonas fluorescens]KII27498.1 Caudovirales tail fiber assembly protein [Pseudomonas fluorescens]
MQRLYSQSTGCTYFKGFHSEIPSDVVAISEARFLEVLANPPLWKRRGHDEGGLPILVDMVPPSSDDLAAVERAWRDAEVLRVSWLRDRHRDQVEVESPTTLSAEQFSELLVYLQALRDWPQGSQFPLGEHRPPTPTWLLAQST